MYARQRNILFPFSRESYKHDLPYVVQSGSTRCGSRVHPLRDGTLHSSVGFFVPRVADGPNGLGRTQWKKVGEQEWQKRGLLELTLSRAAGCEGQQRDGGSEMGDGELHSEFCIWCKRLCTLRRQSSEKLEQPGEVNPVLMAILKITE